MEAGWKSFGRTGTCDQMKKIKEDMNIVIVGHVDHGKSTIIGRLLADTGSLPDGKLAQVREKCRRNARPFEYAFLLDALKEEQAQGITIDSARCFFKSNRRRYLIIDAPGHIEFVRNMVTGAARADAALLVIDADEGIKENSRRHGYLLSLLGIGRIIVLVNKMDLVDYSESSFKKIMVEYRAYLKKIGVQPVSFIPVSGLTGDNIIRRSKIINWFKGKPLLASLDDLPASGSQATKPFRMPVQGIYKFTREGDDRRIIAGTVASGRVKIGDEVIFYPSGKKSAVASIEAFNAKPMRFATAGQATGFTLKEQIYVVRGEVAALAGEKKPQTASRFKAEVFWLGKAPLVKNRTYSLKIGTAKVNASLETVVRVMDADSLKVSRKDHLDRHDVAECVIRTEKAVALDPAGEITETGRFVIVDDYEISGGGIIRETLADEQRDVREKVILRNYKWEKGSISAEIRAERYGQKPILVMITGNKDVGKKAIARALEKKLFDDGKMFYFLGIGNVLYGVDADIKGKINEERREHLRRMAEISNIMIDAGVILIVTAIDLTRDDLELINTVISPDRIKVVWVGKGIDNKMAADLHLPQGRPADKGAGQIVDMLRKQGVIFQP